MTAKSSKSGPGATSGDPGNPDPQHARADTDPEVTAGSGLWHHGVDLARVTAIDLAVLAGHLLLYPTGILPERVVGRPAHDPPSSDPSSPGDDDGDRDGDGDTPDSGAHPPNASNAHPAHPAHRAHAARRTGAARTSPRAAEPEPPAPHPAQDRAHPPVLLLHGFVDNRSAFALLRRSLLRNGWTRVQALNYSPLTTDIRTAAEALGPHIEQICEQSGRRRVDIVAHSLGGLVARYYVQRLGGDARVRTLVTLGTPHSGTRAVPALSPHPMARQMRPGSAVLTELAEPAKGCRTRFVAFWSDLDQVMIPVEAARLEHPDLRTQNIKVTGIGHLSLPVHASVAAEIRKALSGKGPLRAAMDAA